MAKIAMLIKLDRCVGCFACQNACKLVNDLPIGTIWLPVLPKENKPEEYNGTLYMDRFPVPVTLEMCVNCPDRKNGHEPLCASVCMGKALKIGDPQELLEAAKGARAVVFTL